MKVFSIAKGFHRLWKLQTGNLAQKELDRLRAIRVFKATADIELTCATFGISRATLYRWVGRFDGKDLNSLRERSRRPKRLRRPQWSFELLKEVRSLRRQYPRWGKDKLVVLLRARGWKTSTSTVGRIINHLKRQGDIVEPKIRSISSKRRQKRTYAIRKPVDYLPQKPGDLVQIDTLDVRPLPWVVLKQFTARDVICKWDVIEARSNATATTAKEFIDTLQKRMPFPVRAVQVDGGSEFYADFEKTCEKRGIRLFVLPPKSPKLNGSVERANRTHTEEFYEVNECSWLIPQLNEQLRRWEHVYNCIRPHQTLQYKTPLQFLKDNGIMLDYKPLQKSHM